MVSWLICCQLAVATLLVCSASAKWLRHDQVVAALRETQVPAPASVARSLPVVECAFALMIAVSHARLLTYAFAAVALLLIAFTIWLGSILMRGLDTGCACFGASVRAVTWRTLLRNASFIAVCLAGVGLSRAQTPLLPHASIPALAAIVGASAIVACIVATLAVASQLQLSRRPIADDINDIIHQQLQES
jgi:hypothetical protein